MSSDDPELPGWGAGTRTLVLCRSRYAQLSAEPSLQPLSDLLSLEMESYISLNTKQTQQF